VVRISDAKIRYAEHALLLCCHWHGHVGSKVLYSDGPAPPVARPDKLEGCPFASLANGQPSSSCHASEPMVGCQWWRRRCACSSAARRRGPGPSESQARPGSLAISLFTGSNSLGKPKAAQAETTQPITWDGPGRRRSSARAAAFQPPLDSDRDSESPDSTTQHGSSLELRHTLACRTLSP
jgi:hypothetical protein